MFSLPAASTILAPLLAFLAARWLALLVGRRYPYGRIGTMAALGAIASAALPAVSAIGRLDAGAYWLAADAASAAFMGALGATLGAGSDPARSAAPGWRRGLALVAPLGAGLAVAAVSAIPPGADVQVAARAALAFAATLWLTVEARPAAAAIAGVALAIASFGSPAGAWPPIQPIVAAIVSIAALAVASSIVKAGPVVGGGASGDAAPSARSVSAPSRASEAFRVVAAVALAWSLAAIGLGWPASGLAAGVAAGMARRRSRPEGGTGDGTGRFASEAAMALAFIAGYGVSASEAAARLPAAAAVAASVLASTALVSALLKDKRARLPIAAGAFAAMLAARKAGLASDAAMAGLALAYLVAAPLSPKAPGRRAAEDAARRIGTIVGVRPGGDWLGAMALAAALDGRDRPVMAACVAAPDGSPGLGVDQAEETLVRCVAAASAADLRVVPNLVASRGVAAGLARVADERGAELVLVGMDEEADRKTSGTIDGLLASFPGAVAAVKRPGAFKAAKRLVILAVSGAEASPGFARAVEAVARAWAGGSKALEAVMIGAPAGAMLEAAGGLLRPGRISSVASWRDVPDAIGSPSEGDTAFVVLSSRPGTKDWNPGHERLPVVMGSSFPDSPTMLWFPPSGNDEAGGIDAEAEAAIPSEAATRPDGGLPPIVEAAFSAGRVFVDMDEDSLVDAIRRLTDSVFPFDRVASGRLAAQFSAVARKEPIELAPGILLLHAHAGGVALPTLAIGSRGAGWPIIALSSPVRVAVALVSPADSGPEAHLDALTQVATAFRDRDLAARLLA